MSEKPFTYLGDELTLFAHAVRWKDYFGSFIRPYLGLHVLEVGAGMGGTTDILLPYNEASKVQEWWCLEPDSNFCASLNKKFGEDDRVKVVSKKTSDLTTEAQCFNTILYIDVLEHIENDKKELEQAEVLLKTGGYLIILCPAHKFLFSDFDAEIGHFRRYNKAMYRDVVPESLQEVTMKYLDSFGTLLSMLNRCVLQQSLPTLSQIRFWDSKVVPISRRIDPCIGYSFGKSILGIWRKP